MTAPVPSKCPGHGGPGIPANPCTKPGSLKRCLICPRWSGYWQTAEKREAEKGGMAA